MAHYTQQASRIADRAKNEGIIADNAAFCQTLIERANYARDTYGSQTQSCAARIAKLSKKIGNMWDNRNGNLIFAIIRDNRIITIELRRDNQDCRASALGVNKLYTIA